MALSPINTSEIKSFSIDSQSFDTSGRDSDYCEQYDDDPQGCANDPLCESEEDDDEHECEDVDEEDDNEDDDEDEDYCEQYDDNPQGCANDARCESEYEDDKINCGWPQTRFIKQNNTLEEALKELTRIGDEIEAAGHTEEDEEMERDLLYGYSFKKA